MQIIRVFKYFARKVVGVFDLDEPKDDCYRSEALSHESRSQLAFPWVAIDQWVISVKGFERVGSTVRTLVSGYGRKK